MIFGPIITTMSTFLIGLLFRAITIMGQTRGSDQGAGGETTVDPVNVARATSGLCA